MGVLYYMSMKRKTKQQIGYGIFAVAALAVVFVLGRGEPAKTAESEAETAYSQGVLTAAESDFDFGQILMGNGTVSYKYQVTNNTDSAVRIQKVYTSCMCTTATILDSTGKRIGTFGMPGHGGASPAANVTVGPGETIAVDAVFDPAAHGPSGVGMASRAVFLETNSVISPKLELTFKAMVAR